MSNWMVSVPASDHDFERIAGPEDELQRSPVECEVCGLKGVRFLTAPYVMVEPGTQQGCTRPEGKAKKRELKFLSELF